MGDCTSRVTEDEITSHKNSTNSKHDAEFFYEVNLPYLEEIKEVHIKTADEQDWTKKRITMLQKDISRLQQPPSKQNTGLILEVQKGTNLHSGALCLQDPKTYVEGVVYPSNQKFKTPCAAPVIPSWFYLYKDPNLKELHKVALEVKVQVKLGKDLSLGKVVIERSALENQKLLEGWFKLETKDLGSPSLRLRIQFIKDFSELLKSNSLRAKELLPQAKHALSIAERNLDKCEAGIGPEGFH